MCVTRCLAARSSTGSSWGSGSVTIRAPTLSGPVSMRDIPSEWKKAAQASTVARSSSATTQPSDSIAVAAEAATLPCVRRTPFGRPPVPLENGTAARSPSSSAGTSIGSPAGSVRRSATEAPESLSPTTKSSASIPASSKAARTSGAKGPKAMPSRGRTGASTRAASGAVHSGLSGTIAAPARHTPSAATGHQARLGRASATRSPAPTPRTRRPAASAADRAASSPRVSVSPVAPSMTATAVGSSTARRRARAGTVSSGPRASGPRWMVGASLVTEHSCNFGTTFRYSET